VKVLLTGANGYIGSELGLTLAERGHELWRLSRQVPAGKTDLQHDLRDPLPAAFGDDFDLVIHAAGANDVDSRDPAAALSLTALTARHCAAFAAGQRNGRLAYLSTFQVYGRDAGAIDEQTPCRPVNDYALTHFFAEQWLEQYGRVASLPFVNLRIGNVAGMPRAGNMRRWSLTPGCFCKDAVENGAIVVRSTGRQQRDFLSVAEVARRIVQVADDFDLFAGGPVNICSGASVTVGQIAKLAGERYTAQTGKACSVDFRPGGAEGAADPEPLHVDSRYLTAYPAERFSEERTLSELSSCIDGTYQYLKNNTP
jgi:UDP-glucose 4-epimerase